MRGSDGGARAVSSEHEIREEGRRGEGGWEGDGDRKDWKKKDRLTEEKWRAKSYDRRRKRREKDKVKDNRDTTQAWRRRDKQTWRQEGEIIETVRRERKDSRDKEGNKTQGGEEVWRRKEALQEKQRQWLWGPNAHLADFLSLCRPAALHITITHTHTHTHTHTEVISQICRRTHTLPPQHTFIFYSKWSSQSCWCSADQRRPEHLHHCTIHPVSPQVAPTTTTHKNNQ